MSAPENQAPGPFSAPTPDVGLRLPALGEPPRPEDAREAKTRDVVERLFARERDAVAGPLALWRERKHPLVRAAMRMSRRRRLAHGIAGAGLPVALFFAALFLESSFGGTGRLLALVAAGFWPLACFLLAALGAATSVLDERDRDTALQLVLTPLPKRAIAAAKVLPAAVAPMLGIVVALPLYLWAGCAEPLAIGGWPNPLLLFWPLRMLAPAFAVNFGLGSESSPAVWLGGPLMCFTDLALVWAAAHWGAAYAVRTMSFPKTMLLIAGRLALVAVGTGFSLLVAGTAVALVGCTLGMLLAPIHELLAVAAVFGAGLAALIAIGREYLLNRPVRMALRDFTWFDWLAYDAGEERPPRKLFYLPGPGDRP